MDPRALSMIVVAVCATTAFLAKVVLDAILGLRAQRSLAADGAIERRLDRIETAVNAIAVEVERIGEKQRFSGQLRSPAREQDVLRVARQITPH